MISSTLASDPVSGFSQTTCFPAAEGCDHLLLWMPGGVQISMMSMLSSLSSSSKDVVRRSMPNSIADGLQAFSFRSQITRDLELVQVRQTSPRRCESAPIPQPTMATSLDAHVTLFPSSSISASCRSWRCLRSAGAGRTGRRRTRARAVSDRHGEQSAPVRCAGRVHEGAKSPAGIV